MNYKLKWWCAVTHPLMLTSLFMISLILYDFDIFWYSLNCFKILNNQAKWVKGNRWQYDMHYVWANDELFILSRSKNMENSSPGRVLCLRILSFHEVEEPWEFFSNFRQSSYIVYNRYMYMYRKHYWRRS